MVTFYFSHYHRTLYSLARGHYFSQTAKDEKYFIFVKASDLIVICDHNIYGS